MNSGGIAAEAPWRFFRHFDLGNHPAHHRIPSGELDTGRLANGAAASVAADQICGPQAVTGGQFDVDAAVVLDKPRNLVFTIDRHLQLADPVGQDALDVVLPQRQQVIVPGWEIADVQADHVKTYGTGSLGLARGTDRQFRAGRAPRWCEHGGRLRAGRQVSDPAAFRQWQRRRLLAPVRPPASIPSDHPRRSPPHDLKPLSSLPFSAPWFGSVLREEPGLAASPLCAICMKWKGTVLFPLLVAAEQALGAISPNDIQIFRRKNPESSVPWHGALMFIGKKGAGRRLAAVRGGHYVPAPAGRPHGPRRCGGPEHHGVFPGTGAGGLSSCRLRLGLHSRARAYKNQQFLNQGSRIAWIKVNG